MQRLKERLVARRNALNLSQVQLAESSQVSARSIAAYETGSLPTPSRLKKLAGALGVSEEWLMGGEEPGGGSAALREEEIPYRVASIDLTILSEEMLERLYDDLTEQAKATKDLHARKKLNATLNSILQEQTRRRPQGVSEAAAESALASRAVAYQIGKGRANPRGRPESGRPGSTDASSGHKPSQSPKAPEE